LRLLRSLIEADSDIWVAENLAPDLAKEQEDFAGNGVWTDLQYVSFLSLSLSLSLSLVLEFTSFVFSGTSEFSSSLSLSSLRRICVIRFLHIGSHYTSPTN
jgi:hypothetical protein